MGYNMTQTGPEFYGPSLHAYRRIALPGSKNRITPSLTFDDLFYYVIMIHGVLMFIAGALFVKGEKLVAPCLLILEMELNIILLDNPFLVDYIKPKPKTTKYRFDHLARHISIVGIAILVLCAPLAKSDSDNQENDTKQEREPKAEEV